jgi:hypothetical protein
MSWQTINEMLILASVDPDFCQKLLENPSSASQYGFQLSAEEMQVLQHIQAQDIYELSKKIVQQLGPQGSGDEQLPGDL